MEIPPPLNITPTEESERFAQQGRDRDTASNNAPPEPAPPPPGRLTVTEHIYHETGGDHICDSPWQSEEQLSSEKRRVEVALLVTDQWVVPAPDFGPCAMVQVINKAGTKRDHYLSPKETEALKEQWLEIGFAHDEATTKNRTQWSPALPELEPLIVVPAGQSARFRPVKASRMVLRAPHGPLRCLVTYFPL